MAINFSSFIQTDEWTQLLGVMDQMIKDYTDEIVTAGSDGNVSKVMHLTGRIGMLKEIKVLPEYLYETNKGKKENRDA